MALVPRVPRWPSGGGLGSAFGELESGRGRAAGRCGAPRFPAQASPDSWARNLLPTSPFVNGGAELVPVSEASWWAHSSGRCSAAEQESPEKAPGANLQRRALRWAPDGCAAPPVRGAEIPRPQILPLPPAGTQVAPEGTAATSASGNEGEALNLLAARAGAQQPRAQGAQRDSKGWGQRVPAARGVLGSWCWGRGAGGSPGAVSPRWPRAQSGHKSPKRPQEPKVATGA